MKQTRCWLVVYIRKRGEPIISVHMNEHNAFNEFAKFDEEYNEDSVLSQAYLDYFIRETELKE